MGFATIIPFSVVSTLCPSTLPSPCLLLGHKIHLKSWLTKSHVLIVLIGVENINVTFLRHYYFSILHILHVCSARLLNLIYFSDLLFCLTISSWLNCCFNFCVPVFPRVPVFAVVQDKVVVMFGNVQRGSFLCQTRCACSNLSPLSALSA